MFCFRQIVSEGHRFCSLVLERDRYSCGKSVPEVIRGHMATFTTSVSSAATEREVNHFSEFMKKRTPFFLIVFKNDCSEEEEQ